MTINGFFFGRKENLNNGHYPSCSQFHCGTVRTRNLSIEPLESRDLLSVAANPLDADDAVYVSPAAFPTEADSLSVDFPTTDEQTALQSNYATPSGYNHNDYQKIVAFLEQTDESGVKNGKKISSSYNPSDPTTWWVSSSWEGVRWSTVNGEKRISYMDICFSLVGSADFSNFTSLTRLYCSDNQLTSLNVSGCNGLTYLSCGSSQLETLNVTGCTSLTSLYCYDNQLTSLDVSNFASLENLSCYSNNLSSLNISGCTSLIYLHCGYNQLKSLNISNFKALKSLYCYDNEIKSLNVSGCTNLTILRCYYNQLKSLNISGCTNLNDLDCCYNELTALDVSQCTKMTEFACFDNQLTSLDVAKCTELTSLSCGYNNLTSLDVSKCTKLTQLNCSYSDLTSLDVSKCTALTNLYCSDSLLTSLDLSQCTELDDLDCSFNSLMILDISNCKKLTKLNFYNNSIKYVVLSSNRSCDLNLIFYYSSWTIKNSSGAALQTNVSYSNPYTLSASTVLPIYAERGTKTITLTNALPVLDAPTISVAARSSSAITVTVDEVSDARYYEVQYSKSANFANANSKTLSSGSTVISGLDANAAYYFRVKAINGQYCQDSAYSGVKSAKTLQTGQDNDNFSATLVGGVLTITGTTKDDWVEIEQNSQNVVVHLYDAQGATQLKTWSFNANSVNSIQFSGDAGNDVFKNWHRGTNAFASKVVYAYGGDGDDVLIGGSGNDVLFGGEGDDYLDGADGDNRIVTGYGFDTTANTGIGSNLFIWLGYQDFKNWSSGNALGDDDVLLLALPYSYRASDELVRPWTEDDLSELLDDNNVYGVYPYYARCGNWKALALPRNNNVSEILCGTYYLVNNPEVRSYNYGSGVYLDMEGGFSVIHEFGHFWDEDENPYWEEFYTKSWDYNPDSYQYTFKAGCVTDPGSSDFEFTDSYGTNNPFEDWAQCVQAAVSNYINAPIGNGGQIINAKFAVTERFLNWISATSNDFSTPTNLNAASRTSTSISLGWENVSGAPGYTVLYSTSSDFTNASSMPAASNSATVTGLNADSTYYFKVMTLGNDVHTNSSYSPTYSVKTLMPDQLVSPTLSAAVTGFDAVSVTVGSVAHATKYTLEYSLNSNFSNPTSRDVSPGVTTISGLNPNATYYFRVRAIGTGGYSNSEYSSASLNVKLPLAASVQNRSVSHSPSSSMAESVERLTDWDNCYIELWTPGVKRLNNGQTTYTFSYNPDVYSAPSITSCPNGVSMNLSQRTQLSNGNVQYVLTIQVSKAIASQTNNLYLGTIVLTPLSGNNAGMEDGQNPKPVCALNGSELSTTVQSMSFDLVRDGVIDINDFVAFATVFGYKTQNLAQDNPYYEDAIKSDYNKDGIVNVNDFIAFAMCFGKSKNVAAQAIPLPDESVPPVSGNDAETISVSNNDLEESLADNAASEPVFEELVPFPAPAAILVAEDKSESSLTLREAYTAALLDLYDNQNRVELSQSGDALAESRIETLYNRSDNIASEIKPNAAAINAVLEEDLLAIDWNK